MLAYAFYYACPFKSINPYADYSNDEKEDILKKSFVVFPDNQDVLLAIDVMKGLYETTSVKYFNRNKKNLEDIMDYLDTSVLTEGKAEFDELEKNVEAERGKMRAKANRKTGWDEL